MTLTKINVFLILLGLLSPLSNAQKLSVVIFDYPPVMIINNSDSSGYCYEIIEHLYSKLGYQVTKFELNLSRALRSVEAQEIDLICAINTFNSKYLAVSKQSLMSIVFYFWARNDSSFYYDGVSSLEGQRIINISGFNYSSTSQAYQNYLEQSDNIIKLGGEIAIKRAFNMINLGRADIIAIDKDNAYYNLKQINLQDKIKMAGRLPNALPAYLGVSKKHPQKQQLLNQFDTEYPKLIQSGFVDKLLKKYDIQITESTTQFAKPASSCTSDC
ncbi:substrate-binding periplasmic protein [Paraglaciecola aestuariivivens]